jgi:hypothetical protein
MSTTTAITINHYAPDWCDPERNVVALRDTHVVSVVIDGMRYGPGPPEPA